VFNGEHVGVFGEAAGTHKDSLASLLGTDKSSGKRASITEETDFIQNRHGDITRKNKVAVQ
jgi:hypothetical protein